MKTLTEQRAERIARTLCHAAATELRPDCPICDERGGHCTMWRSFMREAELVLKMMKGR
jgi:hypothetical protein